jgi:site-specific recombinase
LGDAGDAKVHKEIIDMARSIPVAAITAHVVKGKLVECLVSWTL